MNDSAKNDHPQRPAVPGFHDDDRFLLTVRHTGALQPGQIQEIQSFVTQVLERRRDEASGVVDRPGALNLSRVTVTFSTAPISLDLDPEEPTLSVLVGDVRLADQRPEERGAAVRVINLLNRRLAAEQPPIENVVSLTATLDWMVGITGDVIIKGGPGTGPLPAPKASYAAALFSGQERVYQHWSAEPQGGARANVVILDTVPDESDLEQAFSDDRNNELLQDLLPHLTMYRDLGQHILSEGHELEDYKYEMVDHGLFVAGIVHLIAPEAKIHLVRVLNRRGVGDLGSLLAGLTLLQRLKKEGPLVINCSLTLAIPPGQETDRVGVWCDAQDGTVTPLAEMCRQLARNDGCEFSTVLVGAAGNDSKEFEPGNHRQPGYPAWLDSVVGVAALGRDGRPPVYSNRADRDIMARELRQSGLATFGGDGADDGVLGVFTAATFPNDEPNTNGWARWSGTSFAAPIISGLVALGLSAGLDADAVLQGIYDAAEPLLVEDPDTAVGEALEIKQG